MTRFLTAVALAGAVALAPLGAQKKADFSGKWQLDKEHSVMPQMGGGGGAPAGGGGGGGRGAMAPAESLTIAQSATELTVDTGTAKHVYKLDGSESTVAGQRGQPMKVTAKWDGDKLVTVGTQSVETPNGNLTFDITETRSLDASGNLTIERVTKSTRGERTMKLVYKKATT